MFIVRLIKSIFVFIAQQITMYQANCRREASIRAMSRLDAHLLDDIGFRKEGDELIPLDPHRSDVSVRQHRRKVRLRCAFLVRRRRRIKELNTQ
jgi:uncharacterized protein YjiS (DUF1127 family)